MSTITISTDYDYETVARITVGWCDVRKITRAHTNIAPLNHWMSLCTTSLWWRSSCTRYIILQESLLFHRENTLQFIRCICKNNNNKECKICNNKSRKNSYYLRQFYSHFIFAIFLWFCFVCLGARVSLPMSWRTTTHHILNIVPHGACSSCAYGSIFCGVDAASSSSAIYESKTENIANVTNQKFAHRDSNNSLWICTQQRMKNKWKIL